MKSVDGGVEPRLSFGILCDGKRLQLWQQRCIEALRGLPGVMPAVLLIRQTASATVSSSLFRFLDEPRPGSPASTAELPAALANLPVVHLPAQQLVAGAAAPSPEPAAAIGAHKLHFILSFSAAAAHSLNDSAAYGVWVFEFGDWEHMRGSPPGFWEVYRNAKVSGAMLARLTADPDVVIPLRRGSLSTIQFSYQHNRDQLLSRFVHWPAQVCRQILDAGAQTLDTAPLRGSTTINTVPCNAGVTRFLCRMGWYILTRGMRSWIEQDHWNIGIVEQPIAEFIDPACVRRPVKWLPAPGKGRFVADPFGLLREGRLTVFCEYLDYRDGIGTIAAIQPFESAPRMPVAIGPCPRVHLSYPQVFEHRGELLCIPETQDAREVALYGLERFPDKWVKLATLIENVAVVDATLFRHGELWWLAGASDPGGTRMGADLHLWYATQITGPWVSHAANPVKTDVRSARPAGTPFVVDGALYRPAQDSSVTYGSRVVINRVQTLTTTAFREEPVAFVEPDVNGPYPHGLHTLSAVGGMTLIDGKRLELAPAEFRRMLGRMIARRMRKLAYKMYPRRPAVNSERHNSA